MCVWHRNLTAILTAIMPESAFGFRFAIGSEGLPPVVLEFDTNVDTNRGNYPGCGARAASSLTWV
jgi:hypothetical protein